MRIGFDAKRAFNNHTGLGEYSRTLINFIIEHGREFAYFLYTPKQNEEIYNPKENPKLSIITSVFGAIWRSLLIYFDIRKNRLDIYHGLAGELPLWIPRNTKTVVTIHDILFERFPNDYNWIDRNIYALKARYACRIADKIVSVSESTKQDLIDFYHIDKHKIEVIHLSLSNTIIQKTKRPYDRKYMICISSFMPRKNQWLLINAFESIANKIDLDLILIGNGKNWASIFNYVQNSLHKNRICFIKNISDDDKFNYLIHSEFSVFPSLYEGFGIPIIESFLYKKPIVLSDTRIHREVAHDAAIFFENDSLEDLKKVILATCNLNKEEMEFLIHKGKQRLKYFDINLKYQRYVELYQTLGS